jgi:hypothetical protein
MEHKIINFFSSTEWYADITRVKRFAQELTNTFKNNDEDLHEECITKLVGDNGIDFGVDFTDVEDNGDFDLLDELNEVFDMRLNAFRNFIKVIKK